MPRFDYVGALRALLQHDVRFVLIGGVAANAHGCPLITQDVDICYAGDEINLERLATALRDMEARLRGVDEQVPFLPDAQTLRAGQNFTFVTTFGSVDVLGMPSGTNGYEDLVPNSEEMDLGDGVRVRVAALDDLIRMKRASGRSKDRVELENLGALREELDKR